MTSITDQPETGNDLLTGAGKGGGTVYAGGAVAPSPSLFSGENPLAGVLPGSVFDPLVNAALEADVPQWFIEHFDVPSFLLPIYQSAAAAYNVPWQVLAAINQVETNFGNNLNVSSAGAVGWMQFLPSTWQRYGLDATDSGVADPYNAADAIFSAARYLNAAGASKNLPAAIFAYNHSTSYVESVLLRAELLSGVPSTLVNSVSELSEGLFPIELRYHPTYKSVEQASGKASGALAAAATKGDAPAPGTVGAVTKDAADGDTTPEAHIFAQAHGAAVAVQDATVVAIGHTRSLGTYVRLKDSFGNEYTYGNLKSVAAYHLVAKPEATSTTASLATPGELASGPAPTEAASAGAQSTGGIAAAVDAAAIADQLSTTTAASGPGLDTASPFAAFDFRPGLTDDATIFGGPRLASAAPSRASLRPSQQRVLVNRYYTTAFGLSRDQLEPRALRVGSHVLGGTILGYLGAGSVAREPYLLFELRPAGTDQSVVDPRPFLDAWSQLATLELHRKTLGTPLYGPQLQSTDAGEALLLSQIDLERVILQNTQLKLSLCERNAIAAGDVDRTVLASVQFLVESGLDPTIGGAQCTTDGAPSVTAATTNADSITISAINSVPVTADPATGSPTDATIKALVSLTGDSAPVQIAGPEAIAGSPNSVTSASDDDQIVVSYAPQAAPLALASTASVAARFTLSPKRWTELDAHLLTIPEPRVPTITSTLALSVKPAVVTGTTLP